MQTTNNSNNTAHPVPLMSEGSGPEEEGFDMDSPDYFENSR